VKQQDGNPRGEKVREREYSQCLETVRLQGTIDTELGQRKLQTGRRFGACEDRWLLMVDDIQRNLPFHAAHTASKRLTLREDSSLNSS